MARGRTRRSTREDRGFRGTWLVGEIGVRTEKVGRETNRVLTRSRRVSPGESTFRNGSGYHEELSVKYGSVFVVGPCVVRSWVGTKTWTGREE